MRSVQVKRWRFAALVMSVAFVWLVVLPRWSKTPMVEARAAWLQEHGISPAAFNYSDHRAGAEMMPALEEVERSLWDDSIKRVSLSPSR